MIIDKINTSFSKNEMELVSFLPENVLKIPFHCHFNRYIIKITEKVMKTIQKQKRGMQTMLKSKRKRKEVFDTVLYTLPAIVLVTMMMYIPFIMSGYYSLTK